MKKMTKQSLKNKYTILIIPVLFLILCVVFVWKTNSYCEKNEKIRVQESYQKVITEGTSFKQEKFDKEAVKNIFENENYDGIVLENIVEARNKDDRLLGEIYEIRSKNGYGGEISILLGVNESGSFCGATLKGATEIVKKSTKKNIDSFLEQFLYYSNEKEFWVEKRVFGGIEVQPMEGAPVSSREIVRLVNAVRVLTRNKNAVFGGQ